MFPLTERKISGYSYGVPTSYSSFHLGTDYKATHGTPVYMPFDGIVAKSVGKQGGLTATVHIPGYTMRFMHLLTIRMQGNVPQGAVFAEADNSGLSSGDHLHLDISKGDTVQLNNHANFVDPEQFDWVGEDLMTEEQFKEIVWNVVNGFYLTYYMRQGSGDEVNAHVDAIMVHDPRKYSISDWVNKQVQEAEFKSHWGTGDATQVVASLTGKIEQIKQIVEG